MHNSQFFAPLSHISGAQFVLRFLSGVSLLHTGSVREKIQMFPFVMAQQIRPLSSCKMTSTTQRCRVSLSPAGGRSVACNPPPSHSDSEWEWVSRLREALANHMLSQLGLPASNRDTLTLIRSVRKVLGLACRRESTNTETFPRRQSAVLEPFPLLLKSHILSPVQPSLFSLFVFVPFLSFVRLYYLRSSASPLPAVLGSSATSTDIFFAFLLLL